MRAAACRKWAENVGYVKNFAESAHTDDLRKRSGDERFRHLTPHITPIGVVRLTCPTKDHNNQSHVRNALTVEQLLTMAEVAKMTRLPIATLRWYRATGKGGPKSGKVGGRRVMYRLSDVVQWIASAFEDGAVIR
jgi:predicted DNA-binding transcriptional regulator AlpA